MQYDNHKVLTTGFIVSLLYGCKVENEDNTVTDLSMFQIFMEGGYLLIFMQILCQLNDFI